MIVASEDFKPSLDHSSGFGNNVEWGAVGDCVLFCKDEGNVASLR